MFGYIQLNTGVLSGEEQNRYRSFYCGLCHVLRERSGQTGRLTLSNDMTFLALLLSALYEPRETTLRERCAVHPLREHNCVWTDATLYAADMNILLWWHKLQDDLADEPSMRARVGRGMLREAYGRVEKTWPRQCAEVRERLTALSRLEKEPTPDLDAAVRLCGQMFGAVFVWKQDAFEPFLRQTGEALGRFIYLMDAHEDYPRDQRTHAFNPLSGMHALPDYEQRIEDILTLEMSQCVQAFACLPIRQDEKLLNNILYSGVWGHFAHLRNQQSKKEKA